MKHLAWTLPLVAFAIAGCGALSAPFEDPGISVVAPLAVSDREGRHLLQATVTPWTKEDIALARLKLYRVDGSSTLVASVDLTNSQLDNTITFGNLKRFTSYRVVAEAFADAGGDPSSQIDNYAFSPASCVTNFSTTNVNPVVLDGINLQLRNQGYTGVSNGASLNVVDGGLDEPTATETITLDEPVASEPVASD